MSYNDDEELKIGEVEEVDDDLDLDPHLHDPLDDDILPGDEEDENAGFAGLDGSGY